MAKRAPGVRMFAKALQARGLSNDEVDQIVASSTTICGQIRGKYLAFKLMRASLAKNPKTRRYIQQIIEASYKTPSASDEAKVPVIGTGARRSDSLGLWKDSQSPQDRVTHDIIGGGMTNPTPVLKRYVKALKSVGLSDTDLETVVANSKTINQRTSRKRLSVRLMKAALKACDATKLHVEKIIADSYNTRTTNAAVTTDSDPGDETG